MRITKVYTGQGDEGRTRLVTGEAVDKDAPRVAAYGDVDELNSQLGWARARLNDEEVDALLGDLQNQLFTLGADLATPPGTDGVRIQESDWRHLESLIDRYVEEVGPLTEFIHPGGIEPAAILHTARCVCRRAERRIVTLSKAEGGCNADALIYANRLSDLLFTLARLVNHRAGASETLVNFPDEK